MSVFSLFEFKMNLIVVDQMVAGWLYQRTLSPPFVICAEHDCFAGGY